MLQNNNFWKTECTLKYRIWIQRWIERKICVLATVLFPFDLDLNTVLEDTIVDTLPETCIWYN